MNFESKHLSRDGIRPGSEGWEGGVEGGAPYPEH